MSYRLLSAKQLGHKLKQKDVNVGMEFLVRWGEKWEEVLSVFIICYIHGLNHQTISSKNGVGAHSTPSANNL